MRLFKKVDIKKRVAPAIVILFFSLTVFSQQKITGVIRDDNRLPLSGVTVTNKNTGKLTLTSPDGGFDIIADSGDKLEFSYVGYKTMQIKVASGSAINLSLPLSGVNLDEVVVTGYTSQKVKEITGSVSVVKTKDLVSIPAGEVEQMLQGRVAGLNVITSGEPGSASIVRIHGIGNLGNVTPLYIIDGVQGDINILNPYDIESLQVLKDAGAYSIYGVRGANGVIVITTKKGKTSKATVQYDFYMGWQKPLNKGLDLLSPAENANLFWKALKNDGLADPVTGSPYFGTLYGSGPVPVLPDYYLAGETVDAFFEGDPRVNPALYTIDSPYYQIAKFNRTGTNWYKEMFKPAFSQNHSLSVSGASEKNSYLFSAGWLDQQGTLLYTYLKRFTARVNTAFAVSKNIRIGENLQFLTSDNPKSFKWETNDYSDIFTTLTFPNYLPVYDIKGGWSSQGGDRAGVAGNPVAIRNLAQYDKYLNWQVFGNAYAEADFLKHFTARTSFGGTFDYFYNHTYLYPSYNFPESNMLTEGSGYNRSWTWTNTINYSQLFKKHSVKVLAGTEEVSNYNRSESASRMGFFIDDPNYRILSNGSPRSQTANSAVYKTLISSFISRFDYGFDNKYLLSITLRRDGSSVFSSSTRFGWFPAFSAAWRLTEENFAKKWQWLTDLKIRGSWGKTGYYGNTSPLNQYTLYGGNISLSYYDIWGNNTNPVQGFRTSYIGNPNTGWQQDIVTNIGLESVLWNGKLSLTADWYVKRTKDLLMPAQLPDILGDATPPNINVGDIKNKGIDLLLGTKGKISKRLGWDLNVMFTTYDNKIVKLNGIRDLIDYSYQNIALVNNSVGHPVGAFYGYKIIGLFQDEGDVAKSPGQKDAEPGRFKYMNLNNNDTINEEDMTFIGNPNPKFTLGLNVGISYRNFDFSAFFYGSFGNDVMNGVAVQTDIFSNGTVGNESKSKTALYNSWTPDNAQAKAPAPEVFANWSSGTQPSSYGLEKGTYFRNKSIIIGYTLPRNLTSKISVSRFRVYAQATNLFTLTKYSGFDPELSGSTTVFGFDIGSYPNSQRQFLLGLTLNF